MLSFPSNREETWFISFSRSIRDDTSHTEPVTLKPLLFQSRMLSLRSTSFIPRACMHSSTKLSQFLH
ncbi:hypothetical protein CUMW_033480 [Citrus unshiu]|nr:hypothetical protein CUMW_033480 [Citrus unshiu]